MTHAFSSHDKARDVFALGAATTLDDGLARMAEWVRRTGAGPATPFSGIEILHGLPPSWARLK